VCRKGPAMKGSWGVPVMYDQCEIRFRLDAKRDTSRMANPIG
jgi:hypothetical protein